MSKGGEIPVGAALVFVLDDAELVDREPVIIRGFVGIDHVGCAPRAAIASIFDRHTIH